jgi:class 3 adenylate cyclase
MAVSPVPAHNPPVETPETHYAKAGTVHIAYQVLGDEGPDLILAWGGANHLDLQWAEPHFARFLTKLSSFSRLIMFDARGSGLPDRASELPVLELQMDDITAVLDAVGSERCAVFGSSQGGLMASLFAATYPERCSGLVLYGAFARTLWAPDYPWGRRPEIWAGFTQLIEREWGSGVLAQLVAADEAAHPAFVDWWRRFERLAAGPGGMLALLDLWAEIDLRGVVEAIGVPTLVLQRRDDTFRDPANARYLAEHIPGARLVELEGRDHLPFLGDGDAVVSEVEEFLTGARRAPEPDRVLATILFTDIVGSTEHAALVGDRVWRETLSNYYALCRRHFESFRGREVKTTGDGVLAAFDGPARAVRCARAITDAAGSLGLQVRAGVHTGECEIVGDDLAGLAVHIGARVASLAAPGEVLASSTVKDLVAGSGLTFEDRGASTLRGVPGEWRLFAVTSAS